MTTTKSSFLTVLGIVPLLAALYSSFLSLSEGKPAELLWLCNLNNFLLALGLFARHEKSIRVATLWLIIGTPLWVWDNIERGVYFTAHAFVIHVIGAALGVYAVRRLDHQPRIWVWALLYGLSVQLITRFVAPPELNINVASQVYPPLQPIFSDFYYYMGFNVVCFALVLNILERLLNRTRIKNTPPVMAEE